MRAFLLSALLALPAVPVAAADLFAEVRAVHDVARLDLRRLGDAPGDAWSVLQIDAEASSGNLRFPGVTMESGAVKTPPGVEVEAIVAGEVTVLASLQGETPAATWTYRWTFGWISPRGEDAALFSPFRGGGTAVARVRPQVEGAGRFAEVFSIPAEWSRWVGPARQALLDANDLFAVPRTPQRRSRLIDFLSAENPFLAVAAFRALATDPAAQHEMRQAVAAAQGPVLGAFLYLALASQPSPPRLDSALAGEPRGFGVGALAAYLHGDSPAIREAGRTALRWLQQHRVLSAGENGDLASFLSQLPLD